MLRLVVVFVGIAFVANDAGAAGVLKLTNAGREIPLLAGSQVHFDADGTLRMECDPAAASCLGGAEVPAGALPAVTFSRIDSDAALTAGESITLAWTSSGADVCHASSSASTAWSGARAAGNAGGEPIVLSLAGTYTFSLSCYNLSGGTQATPLSVTVGTGGGPTPPPPPPPSGCSIVSNDPAFQPASWKRIDKSWTTNFSAPDGHPAASYAGAISWPVPVGSQRGAYTTIAFTPNPGQSVSLHWDRIQARAFEYEIVRPASGMFFGISPCPGDLRAVNPADASGWLKEGCRQFASSSTLTFTTLPAFPVSTDAVCKLEAGKTYYLNIAPVDPTGGLAPGEHSCDDVPNTALECHVGVVIGTSQ